MRIRINGEATEVSDDLSVADLLVERQVQSPDMVSVELDGTILKREEFPATVIEDGAEVEFLYFMGGGRSAWN